jgi:hypothetical protein
MARLALTVAGAILGAALAFETGGLSVGLGMQLGALAGGIIGTIAFPAKGTKTFGPRVNDLQISSSAPGTVIPRLWGTMRLGGQIIWGKGIKEVTTTTNQSAKGGPSVSQTSYTYFSSFAAAFCQGPATITRIWGDAKLIFDKTGTGQIAKDLTVVPTLYQGTNTQTADPFVTSQDPANSTPGYRDTCYAVWDQFPLADFGNRLPNIRAEVTANAQSSHPLVRAEWEFNSNVPQYCVTDPNETTAFVVGDTGHIVRYDLGTNLPVASGVLDITHMPGYTGGDSPIGVKSTLAVDNDGYIWAYGNLASQPHYIKYDGWSFQAVAAVNLSGYSSDGFYSYASPTYAHMLVNPDGSSLLLTGNSGYSNEMFAIRTRDASLVGVSTDFRIPFLPADTTTIGLFWQNYPVCDNNANVYFIGTGVHDSHPTGYYGDWYIWRVNLQGGTSHFVALAPQYVGVTRFAYQGDSSVGIGQSMLYNANDNTLIVYTNTGAFLRIDADTGDILETIGGASDPKFNVSSAGWNFGQSIGANNWLAFSDPFDGSNDSVIADMKGRVQNGLIWAPSVADNNIATVYNVSDFSVFATYDLAAFGPLHPTTPPTRGNIYESRANSLLSFNYAVGTYSTTSAFHRYYFDRVSTGGYGADQIVKTICETAGIADANIDVSLLQPLSVLGYPVAQLQNGKDQISALAQFLFFDAREIDFKLQFVPRGQSPIATLPEDELGLEADKAKLEETIGQEQDIPKDVDVIFIDPNIDYQQNHQKRIRHSRTKKTVNLTSLSLPIVMTANDALQLADRIMWSAEAERRAYKTNLWKAYWMLFDPCDVVQLNYNGSVLTARITDAALGQNFVTAMQLKSEDSANYTSLASGSTGTGFVGQTIQGLAQTLLFLLDIPYLRDIDADAAGNIGYYVGMDPWSNGSWRGGVLYNSSDEVNWNNIGASLNALAYGTATTVLAAPANPWTWDYVNTLTVRMTQGAPSSTSALNVLNGRNVAILYPSLEIIQFQNATLNGDGTYTLDTLLRGRRGTEWACGTAGQGERVLFPLIQGGLLHEQTALSLLNATRSYRAITLGADQNSTGVVQTLALKGRDLMPYAPCQITGSRDGSNNLLIQWQRRTRLGATNIAGGKLTLAEDTESYDVVIVDGSGNVLRTFANVVPNSGINWTSPAFPHVTYSAANQTTDGITPGDPVHVILYQNSVQVGRGFATLITTI